MKTQVNHNVLNLRVFLALLIVLTEVVYLDNLFDAPFEVVLSSAAVSLALLLELAYAVREDVPIAADGAVFIFNWLFLDLAPKIQLIGTPAQLVNTSGVTAERIALTNLMCALFIVTFTCVYALLSSRSLQSKVPQPGHVKQMQREYTASGVGITLFVCVAVVALAAPTAYHSVDRQETVSPGLLIMNRFLLFLPSAALLILLHETLGSARKVMFTRVCGIILLLVLVMVTENTYTEKRNALGPLYLSLLLIGFQGWFKNRTRRLLLLVISLVLGFPALEVFTHNHSQALSDVSLSELGERIEEYYFSINYDAWSNLYASTEIVAKNGLQWGHQLLGSLLFFVPSAVWTDKPLATGIFIGQYLINHYSMWFTNLSAPLVAEAYLDFGSVGVVLYAGVLAWLVASLNKFALRRGRWWNVPLAVYASMFLVFMLRGSLMVAMGFASAAFLSFATASALLSIRLESDRERVLTPARKMSVTATNSPSLPRGV